MKKLYLMLIMGVVFLTGCQKDTQEVELEESIITKSIGATTAFDVSQLTDRQSIRIELLIHKILIL